MFTVINQRLKRKLLRRLEIRSKGELCHFYFGYGANANPNYFKNNISRYSIVGTSCLEGYRFSFNTPCEYKGKGFGGLEESSDSRTYGTLYLVSKEALDLLDCLEWVENSFYFRKKEKVFVGQEPFEAHLYFPCHPRIGLIPSLGYKKIVLKGAEDMNFPLEYCKMLEGHEHGLIFNLDHSFNLSNPGKLRLLPYFLRKLHDQLREILCRYV